MGLPGLTYSNMGILLSMSRLHAKELKPMHDWVKTYERYWTHQLDQIKQRAELKMANQLGKQLMKREEGE